MSLLLIVVAVVVFLLAAFTDGIGGASPADLSYIGLALFALAHVVGDAAAYVRRG